MFTYTDLTLELKVNPEYLADGGKVFCSFVNDTYHIDIETDNYNSETGVITVELTQAQTKKLKGKTRVQVGGFLNGKRWASNKAKIVLENNLLKRVIDNA